MKLYLLAEQNLQRARLLELMLNRMLHTEFNTEWYRDVDDNEAEYFIEKRKPDAVGITNNNKLLFFFPSFYKENADVLYLCDYQDPLELRVSQIISNYFTVEPLLFTAEIWNTNSDQFLSKNMKWYTENKNYYFKTKDGRVFGKENLKKL